MGKSAKLLYDGKEIELPLLTGTENEDAIDISKIRSETGLITLDKGYKNTGATTSKIPYLDGEKGILRHRGYSIEELAEKSSFIEVAYLVIYVGGLKGAASGIAFHYCVTFSNGFLTISPWKTKKMFQEILKQAEWRKC